MLVMFDLWTVSNLKLWVPLVSPTITASFVWCGLVPLFKSFSWIPGDQDETMHSCPKEDWNLQQNVSEKTSNQPVG